MTQLACLGLYLLFIFSTIFFALLSFRKATNTDNATWECFWYALGLMFLTAPLYLNAALTAIKTIRQ